MKKLSDKHQTIYDDVKHYLQSKSKELIADPLLANEALTAYRNNFVLILGGQQFNMDVDDDVQAEDLDAFIKLCLRMIDEVINAFSNMHSSLQKLISDHKDQVVDVMTAANLTAKEVVEADIKGMVTLLGLSDLTAIDILLHKTPITISSILRAIDRGVTWGQLLKFAKQVNAMPTIMLMWENIVVSDTNKRLFLLENLRAIYFLVARVEKIKLFEIKELSIADLKKLIEDNCLNATQESAIRNSVLFHADDIRADYIDNPDLMLSAFKASITNAPPYLGVFDDNILVSINAIRKVYMHRYPQNLRVGLDYAPVQEGMVSYIHIDEHNGESIEYKPEGLLSLEQYDSTDTIPADRKAVRFYVRKLMNQYIDVVERFSPELRQFIQDHAEAVKKFILATNINIFDIQTVDVAGLSMLLALTPEQVEKLIVLNNQVYISMPEFVKLGEENKPEFVKLGGENKEKQDLFLNHANDLLQLKLCAGISWQELVQADAALIHAFLTHVDMIIYLIEIDECDLKNLLSLNLDDFKSFIRQKQCKFDNLTELKSIVGLSWNQLIEAKELLKTNVEQIAFCLKYSDVFTSLIKAGKQDYKSLLLLELKDLKKLILEHPLATFGRYIGGLFSRSSSSDVALVKSPASMFAGDSQSGATSIVDIIASADAVAIKTKLNVYYLSELRTSNELLYKRIATLTDYVANANENKTPSLTVEEIASLENHEYENFAVAYDVLAANLITTAEVRALKPDERKCLMNPYDVDLNLIEQSAQYATVLSAEELIQQLRSYQTAQQSQPNPNYR